MSDSHTVKDRDTGTSDPAYVKLQTNNLPWYTEDITGQLDLVPEVRKCFETYSNISPDQVIEHIRTVRAKLWNLRAYPCTGLYAFLAPWIRYHSAFSSILQKLASAPDAKVLDVGCYIGHDLRALHFAGVPLTSIYGLDILPFWDLGYELFNDREKFNVSERCVIGDILDFNAESEAANLLDGKMDVVWCSAVIHQFPWDKQVAACKRLVQFTKGSGAMIAGCVAGTSQGETFMDVERLTSGRVKGGNEPFKHNKASMERLWKTVGEELGLNIEAQADWGTWERFGNEPERCKNAIGDDMGVVEFTVRLL